MTRFQSSAWKCLAWMAVAVASIAGVAARAQEHSSAPTGPAPILMTVRETLRPGAEGDHAKLEAEYAAALDAGKGGQYYLGMGAITGTPRTVFISGYSSLEQMSEVHDYDEVAMGEKLADLDEEHSGTLTGEETAIWRLRPELSSPGAVNLANMRFMELVHIHVKLGHGAEFADLINHLRDGWTKADADFHFTIYQQTFGNSTDDSYMVVIPVRSLADLDKHHALVAEYRKSLGEEIQKRMAEFESANYRSAESNLFAFTPSMSRLPPSWTKDDADFWRPKPAAAVPVKKAEKAK